MMKEQNVLVLVDRYFNIFWSPFVTLGLSSVILLRSLTPGL